MKRVCCAAIGVLALAACGAEEAPVADAQPAAVAKLVAEADLATVRLNEDAAKRLGIETAPVTSGRVGRTQLYAGEVVVALGRPAEQPSRDGSPSIYSVLPPLNPADLQRAADLQVSADGAVTAARIARDTARENLSREQGLLASKAGSGRAVDDARAQLALAEAALRNAMERRNLLGAPFFASVASQRPWLRVAIYAGDLDRIDLAARASTERLGSAPGADAEPIQPVALPVSASTATATTDLLYEPVAAQSSLRPGARVAVRLPLRESSDALLIERGALVRDIHGGAWVYEEVGERAFARRRVEVREHTDAQIALASGPPPGARVVTAGAEELFAIELGFAK